jgi:hypothetical protein
MIKKILFSLAALSIYANAINCVEAYFMLQQMEYYIPSEYVLDSLYKVPKEGMESEPWFKKQYYTPGNYLPDSIVMADENRTVKNVFNFTQETTTEDGMQKIVVKNNGEFYRSVKYFASADSVSYEYTDVDLDEKYTTRGSLVLRNDSLFVYEFGERSVVYLDSNDINVCYDGIPGDENFMKITYEAKGDTIHFMTDSEYSLTDLFFIPLNPGTSSIRKIRPVANIKKFQYFDLLGRPAINKHSVQVRK